MLKNKVINSSKPYIFFVIQIIAFGLLFFFTLSKLSVKLFATSASSGQCPDGWVSKDEQSADGFAYSGSQTITKVGIKSGNDCFLYENGGDSCYQINGINSSTVSVIRIGDGEGQVCQAISHVVFYSILPSPTPTPTTGCSICHTPTPICTCPVCGICVSPTATLTPTSLPTQTPTLTLTPTIPQYPTATPTEVPYNTIVPTNTPTTTSTPTPTLEITNTPSPTSTPGPSYTPTPQVTGTSTPTPTSTPTVEVTNTPGPSNTPGPEATGTPGPVATNTPAPGVGGGESSNPLVVGVSRAVSPRVLGVTNNYNPLVEGIRGSFPGSVLGESTMPRTASKGANNSLPTSNQALSGTSLFIPKIGVNEQISQGEFLGGEPLVGHQEILRTKLPNSDLYYAHNGSDLFGSLYKMKVKDKAILNDNNHTQEYQVVSVSYVHQDTLLSQVDKLPGEVKLSTCSLTKPEYRIVVSLSKI